MVMNYFENILLYISLLIFSISLPVTPKRIYKEMDTGATWAEAASHCREDGGRLAVIHALDIFSYEVENVYTSINFTKAWVGGQLLDRGWNWLNRTDGKEEYLPVAPVIQYRGCYQPKYITGGSRLREITAKKCFKKCLWQGAVGLKKTVCICEGDLRNISWLPDDGCYERCSGNREEKCGSPRGTSVYQLSENSVLWGKGEPSDDNGCAYIRKYDVTQEVFWHTADCNTRHRYLCQFKDHRFCGIGGSCIKPSISPATWQQALSECQKLNGSAAIVNVSMIYQDVDIRSLPPGVYWIGLKRIQKWKWIDDTPVLDKSVKRYFKDGGCVSLKRTDGVVKLKPETCQTKLPYVCEYDMIEKLKITEEKIKIPSIGKDVLINNANVTDVNKADGKSEMYKSIMYLAIGVAAGLGFVFGMCVVIYLIRRCYKHSKTSHHHSYGHKRDNFAVCSSSNASSIRSAHAHRNGQSDILYDIPIDSEGDDPFRRTQRIIRQGSWNPEVDGYRSNSWRRTRKGEHGQKKGIIAPEIRAIYPSTDRSFRDASYVIHKVQAQCHPNNNLGREVSELSYTGSYPSYNINRDVSERNYTGSLNITRYRNIDTRREEEVRLADTYSLPPPSRKQSENEFPYHVDTSDLYTCVARAMNKLHENTNNERQPQDEDITYY